jgi:epsilon-lactone hydrolase
MPIFDIANIGMRILLGPAAREDSAMPSEQMQAFIDALRDRIPPDGNLTVDQHRAMHDDLLARRPPDEDVRIEATTLGGVAAEWVWAEGVPADRVVLYCHGGGFRAGSPRGSRQFAGRLSRASRARVALLDYRLAPEHQFPAALDDVIAGYRGLLDAGHAAASIAFGGESIGGGTLALAALPAVRESGLPLPASAFALSPLTDLTLSSPAITDPAGRDPLARDGSQFTAAVRDYLPRDQDPAAPLVSPLYADWSGLPPVHIEVGSTERLIDDARRLAERARLAGVPATLEVTEDAVHAFAATAPDTPEAKAAIERIAHHLTACLETSGDPPQLSPQSAGAGVTAAFATSQESRMFARVITAQAGPQGLDSVIGLAREQLPGASDQPGFRGFYLLTNAETGKAMTISLWETREQMPAGIRDQGLPATGLTPPQLETYEVAVRA